MKTVRIAYRVGGSDRWEWRLTLSMPDSAAPEAILNLERMGYKAFAVGEHSNEFDLPLTWDDSQGCETVVNTYGDGYCAGTLRGRNVRR